MPRVQCLYNYRLHVITQHTHTHVYLLNPEMIPPTCGESQHISVVCLVTDTDTDYYRALNHLNNLLAFYSEHMSARVYSCANSSSHAKSTICYTRSLPGQMLPV